MMMGEVANAISFVRLSHSLMIRALCPITSNDIVGPSIHIVSFESPPIASSVQPGQFVNVRVSESSVPLLRRPFSVYRVERDDVSIIFNVVGLGTRSLSQKRIGEQLDVIGPLGRPFSIDDDYSTALLVAGGLGVAPLPLLTRELKRCQQKFVTYCGAQTAEQLVEQHLENLHVATDDGTKGFHGTVIDLLRSHLESEQCDSPKIFGCGPTAMLRSLTRLANEFSISCEVSLESAMACGIGICQGCPVERRNGEKKYALVCADGPVFDTRTIRIE
jgi:dihydroorotate dehydrogenase electron transfer subunit